MTLDPGIIIALVALVGSLATAWFTYRSKRADAAESISAAAAELIKPYREEVGRLRKIVDELRDRITTLESDNFRLQSRVGDLELENQRLSEENRELRGSSRPVAGTGQQ